MIILHFTLYLIIILQEVNTSYCFADAKNITTSANASVTFRPKLKASFHFGSHRLYYCFKTQLLQHFQQPYQ